jgi:tripartite-type tricarboxylate transporter receptor subunit TctC
MLRKLMLVFAGVLALAVLPSHAQDYPQKPVRIIVPFPAGGPVDSFARQLAQRLTEAMHQTFLVENRAGGNTIIGTDSVAKAQPDGYSLLITASSFVTTPMLNKAPYDAMKDFSHIAFLARAPLALVVNPQLPVANVKELIEYARKNPQNMMFGVGSVGAPAHLAQEMFRLRANVPVTMVPYKGSTPIFQDLMAGQITGAFEPVLGVIGLIQSGRLKCVAITSQKRISALPGVATVQESGLPGYEAYTWYGFWGPAGMPAGLVKKLNEEVNKALAQPDLRDRLEKIGFEIQPGSPERFVKFLQEDAVQAAAIIREANIRTE